MSVISLPSLYLPKVGAQTKESTGVSRSLKRLMSDESGPDKRYQARKLALKSLESPKRQQD